MSDKYNGVDTFIYGIGTVRECMGCGALIAGGPTRCIRCAETGDPVRRRRFRIPLPPPDVWLLLIPLAFFLLFIVGFIVAVPYIVAWRYSLP